MFMSVTLESSVCMGKNCSFYQKYKRSHNETNVRTYLQNWCPNKMRSVERKQLIGKIVHGNTRHSLVTKGLSIFNARRSTSFRILYCVLVRYMRTPNQTLHGNKDWSGTKTTPEYRTLDRIDGEPMKFE